MKSLFIVGYSLVPIEKSERKIGHSWGGRGRKLPRRTRDVEWGANRKRHYDSNTL